MQLRGSTLPVGKLRKNQQLKLLVQSLTKECWKAAPPNNFNCDRLRSSSWDRRDALHSCFQD